MGIDEEGRHCSSVSPRNEAIGQNHLVSICFEQSAGSSGDGRKVTPGVVGLPRCLQAGWTVFRRQTVEGHGWRV